MVGGIPYSKGGGVFEDLFLKSLKRRCVWGLEKSTKWPKWPLRYSLKGAVRCWGGHYARYALVYTKAWGHTIASTSRHGVGPVCGGRSGTSSVVSAVLSC